MERINIGIHDNQERLVTKNWLEDMLSMHNLNIEFTVFNQAKGRQIALEDNEIVRDQLVDAVISQDIDAYIISADELPYPLDAELEVYAVYAKEKVSDDQVSEHPLNSYWAIVGKKGSSELKTTFGKNDVREKWGYVVLAGYGPGDHRLITRKAEFHLHKAEVIFYDDLVNDEFLRRFCAKKIYVGKRKGRHKFDQEKINELMYQEALKGKWVVRIKGGDPLIFGRGAEEYHYLQSRLIKSEIIPGISSAFAAAAGAVIPFTERSLASSVAFLSGHDLHKIKIPQADTLVFFMGASNQQELAQKIIDEGWEEATPVGVVHNASTPEQQIYRGNLEELRDKGSGLPSPSIIIVGKTAGEYVGKNVKWLYTGASLDEVKSTVHLVHTPLISIESIEDTVQVEQFINNISNYNRIVFTNRYAVQHFFKHLYRLGKDARSLWNITIDSIGKTTSKALRQHGIVTEPVGKKESLSAMLQAYQENKVSGEKILVPGSSLSTGDLQSGLVELGNKVDSLWVYNVVKNKAIIKQNLSRFEGIIFSSPATVKAFFEVYEEIPSHVKVKCRGAQTEKTLKAVLNDFSNDTLSAV